MSDFDYGIFNSIDPGIVEELIESLQQLTSKYKLSCFNLIFDGCDNNILDRESVDNESINKSKSSIVFGIAVGAIVCGILLYVFLIPEKVNVVNDEGVLMAAEQAEAIKHEDSQNAKMFASAAVLNDSVAMKSLYSGVARPLVWNLPGMLEKPGLTLSSPVKVMQFQVYNRVIGGNFFQSQIMYDYTLSMIEKRHMTDIGIDAIKDEINETFTHSVEVYDPIVMDGEIVPPLEPCVDYADIVDDVSSATGWRSEVAVDGNVELYRGHTIFDDDN